MLSIGSNYARFYRFPQSYSLHPFVFVFYSLHLFLFVCYSLHPFLFVFYSLHPFLFVCFSGAPRLTITPPVREYRVDPGQQITLECVASGDPQPVVYWEGPQGRRREEPEGLSDGDPSSAIMMISSVRPADAGVYTCVARSAQGESTQIVELIGNLTIIDETKQIVELIDN